MSKWAKRRLNVGIKSNVPNSTLHYCLFDIDNKDNLYIFVQWLRACFPGERYMIWESPHGLHAVLFKKVHFRLAVLYAENCPYVDRKWIEIAQKRGYFFLASYTACVSNMFTYMAIYRRAEWQEKNTARLSG